ncbi:MAG: Ig-like domain-containing protein [Anaerolineales bacterium]|nr:Ig-like domain-containing protein [Anaerolineales bacterium]
MQPKSLESRANYRQAAFKLILLLAFALFGASCGQIAAEAATTSPEPTRIPPTATALPGLPAIDSGAPLPPQVISQSPSANQEIGVDGVLEITFDQPMDQDATKAALQVVDTAGDQVSGELHWSSERTLQFTPSVALGEGQAYLVTISTEAASAEGVGLAEPVSWQFFAAGALQITQVFPADGAVEVEGGAVITVIFNRPVAPLVIAEEQGNLPDPLRFSPPVTGKGEWVNTSVYTFRPDTGLVGDTTYTVSIAAGLKDAAEQSSLQETYEWSFTTISPDINSYWIEGQYWNYNPADYTMDVLLDDAFAISFYQAMDAGSVEENLTMVSSTGEPVLLDFSWSEHFLMVTITPTQQLAYDTAYQLKLNPEAQAATGGGLKRGLTWNFYTIRTPGIDRTMPADRETVGYFTDQFMIDFRSPMDLNSMKDKVIFEPAIGEGEPYWYYDEWNWSLYFYGLEPSVAYSVRILPGMKDIYGTEITSETLVRFTNGPREPFAYLQMPYGVSLYREDGPQEFYASYMNISQVDLSLYRLPLETFLSLESSQVSPYSYRPPAEYLVWEMAETETGTTNELIVKSLPLAGKAGDPLALGFYFLGMDAPEVANYGNPYDNYRLLFVASANITLKTTRNEVLVWLTDLETGEPLPGITVNIYNNLGDVVGSGVTDQDGVLYVDDLIASSTYGGSYYAVTDLASGELGFASSYWDSDISLYDYGIWSDFYTQPNRPTAYVYTERPIYRPGQPVYFKGIVRIDDDLSYSLPSERTVEVTIESFEEIVYLQKLTLSDYGSFNGEFLLDGEAALGWYTISVRFLDDTSIIGSVGFSVAEYRRPEFQISVAIDPTDTLPGTEFEGTIEAQYYSGGAVSGADTNWSLMAEPYYFTPPDVFAGYSFSDNERDYGYFYYQYYGPTGPEVIAQGSGKTDADGQLVVTLPAELGESGGSRRLTLEASITDLAGAGVTGRSEIIVHRSAVYPGIRSTSYVGETGEEQTIEVVALDWDGEPIEGQTVLVVIVERRWYSVQEQDPQGRIIWTSSVEEIPVAEFEDVKTDERGKATVSFIPPNGGVYRARVTVLDEAGNSAYASTYLWVASDLYIPWRQGNDHGFELVLDKTTYTPGETAEILIASPFQGDTYALVTTERGHIRSHEVVLLTSNSTIYRLPITADMAPNIYIFVTIIKGVDETSPQPDFRIGVAQLKVETSAQALRVEIIPDRLTAGPGDDVEYTIRTTDLEGMPVSAEVSLSLSDLATLSLSAPNSRPILDYFYGDRSLSVWTSMPLVNSAEYFNADVAEELAREAPGSGGGKGDDSVYGVIEIRQDFPDTAFWEARLVTDEDGEASVTVTLPDNLTTWRMEGRAFTLDTRLGQTTVDIVSTKPLLVRPQTPRFFVAGDEVILGSAVHNNTETDLTVNVTLNGEGVLLDGAAEQTVKIPAGQQAYITWSVSVLMDAERVDLVFSAQSGEYSDASRPTLGSLENQGIPVYHYEVPETVGTGGQILDGDTIIEAIYLPEAYTVGTGELVVRVSPSLAAGMTDGLKYLEHYPYECVEQTISRFLPNVITTQALQAAGLGDDELEAKLTEQVNIALQRLYNWQNPDGGWGWWTNQKSDPQTTAYVILGLVKASQAEYTVSEDVLDSAITFLRSKLESVGQSTAPYLRNRQAFLLYVLAQAEEPNVSRTVQLYEYRQSLDYYARAYLAWTLHAINPDDPRVETLLSDLNTAAITSATGTHWEEKERDYWNWNTNTRTTAIVLSVVSELDAENPLNANAVRWLMVNRTDGHWWTTQETAWSLMALTNWMVASGELQADYEYGVALNGEQLGGGEANAETLRETTELRIDIADLLADEANRLAIARSDGTGNLYYTAHLKVYLPVKDVQALDQGIIISRAYYTLDDLNTPVSLANQGDLLMARLTVIAPHDLHYVVIDDPLPAGLEAVDQSLLTSPQSVDPTALQWDALGYQGWGWWYFDHVEMQDEKLTLSANYLPAGAYVYTYLVRASTLGAFQVIPPTAEEFYFPEVYGRGDGMIFEVKP